MVILVSSSFPRLTDDNVKLGQMSLIFLDNTVSITPLKNIGGGLNGLSWFVLSMFSVGRGIELLSFAVQSSFIIEFNASNRLLVSTTLDN